MAINQRNWCLCNKQTCFELLGQGLPYVELNIGIAITWIKSRAKSI